MKKENILIVIVALLLFTIAIATIILFNQYVNWMADYRLDNKDPFGTSVVYSMLQEKYSTQHLHTIDQRIDTLFKDKESKPSNYLFIGDRYIPTDNYLEQILEFVKQGNTAFISASHFHSIRLDAIYYDYDCENEKYILNVNKPAVTLTLPGISNDIPPLTLRYINMGKYMTGEWNYFDSSAFCNDTIIVNSIGCLNGEKINFISIQVGKGTLYLHSTPMAFSNYYLSKNETHEYANTVLSVLNEGEIFWDEYSKIPHYSRRNDDGYDDLNSYSEKKGPLSFILSHRSLKWAWYLTLILVLIYVVVIGKRRQRIIPILSVHRNTSLEYIKTVGKLYYIDRNNLAVGIHKMKQFHSFLRNRYFILSTQRNDELAGRIAMVSGVELEHIKKIFVEYALIEVRTELSDDELIHFHQLLEIFYKACI